MACFFFFFESQKKKKRELAANVGIGGNAVLVLQEGDRNVMVCKKAARSHDCLQLENGGKLCNQWVRMM